MSLNDYLFEGYDLPRDALTEKHSRAFEKFVIDVFVYSGRDGFSVDGLVGSELQLAKEIVRTNLRYGHVREAAVALRDGAAVPLLEALLALQADISHRASIALCLFQITHDPKYTPAIDAWEDLGEQKKREHLEASPEYEAAIRAFAETNAAVEQIRQEYVAEAHEAAQHNVRSIVIVVLVTAGMLALIFLMLAYYVGE